MFQTIFPQNFYLILQLLFLVIGFLLLFFGVKVFNLFLYCVGICTSFLVGEYLKPYAFTLYNLDEQKWLYIIIGSGIVLGFIFIQTYKISFYLATTIAVYFTLNYYFHLLFNDNNIILLTVASIIGGVISYFFKRTFVMLLSASLGAIFFSQSLPLIYFVNKFGFRELLNLILQIKDIPLSSNLLVGMYQMFQTSLIFNTIPLLLMILGFCCQYFITGKKRKLLR